MDAGPCAAATGRSSPTCGRNLVVYRDLVEGGWFASAESARDRAYRGRSPSSSRATASSTSGSSGRSPSRPPLAIAASPWKAAQATRPALSTSPADDLAGGLAPGDQRERAGEGAVGRLAQRVGAGAVLARVHQIQQRARARSRSARRCARGAPSRVANAGPAPLERGGHLAPEALEAVQRERVEQRLLAREVPPRRRVADADLARELAQRQLAAAASVRSAAPEQRRAEVPVVVGAGGCGHAGKGTRRS